MGSDIRPHGATTARQIAARLRQWDPRADPRTAVAGCDGFVDEMISVVGERHAPGKWTALPSMADLGRVLIDATGRNGLREIVVHSADAGGCSVNLSDGLATLGVAVHHFGTTGNPRHPAFAEFAERCASCTAWGSVYGRSLCLEFTDGKFFLAAVDQLSALTADVVRAHLADGIYAERCAQADLIVLNNWSLYPHMTAIWQVLNDQVFTQLSHRPWGFIDLVDPTARSSQDIHEMLTVVSGFEANLRIAFGVNLTEAAVLTRVLGLPDPGADLVATAIALRERIGVSEVIVHNRSGNAVAWDGGAVAVHPGPTCAAPVKSTGAGDRFNAGYSLGLTLGLNPAERLDLGSAVAGVFLRQGRSATTAELLAFLDAWN